MVISGIRLDKLYMLDTNIVSAEFKGKTAVGKRLEDLPIEQWCISAITRSELVFGASLLPQAVKLNKMVNTFLCIARTMPWDAAAASCHGKLRAELCLKGTPIGDFDEMIAAHALSLGAILVTDNVRHFSRVPDLKIENWLREG